MDGSICLRSRRLPADFDRLRASVCDAAPLPTVFVCLHGDDRVRDLLCRPLEIPPLAARASESHRLLQEALDEAATALGTGRLRLPRQARQGVLERVASFAELEKTALRVVALTSARNPSQAAVRLGMAPVSLTRWLHRRPWLMAVLRELKAHRFHATTEPPRLDSGGTTMDHPATLPAQEPGGRMHPFDAFERICYDVLDLEACRRNAYVPRCLPRRCAWLTCLECACVSGPTVSLGGRTRIAYV